LLVITWDDVVDDGDFDDDVNEHLDVLLLVSMFFFL
jgi:hypothetical protein